MNAEPPIATPPRTPPTLWALLAVLVVLMGLAAFFGLRAWQAQLPAEASADVTFARDMMAHHQQAVEMALFLRDRTSNAELKQFTLDILLTQQAQIGQMQGWLAAWGAPINGAQPPMQGMGMEMGMATQQQLNELRSLPVPQAENAFLALMIRHHQGGVAMAVAALPKLARPEAKRLAEAIVTSQQNEIDFMQAVLKERGVQVTPLPTLAPMHH